MKISIKGILIILFGALFLIVSFAFKENEEVSWVNPDGSSISCRYPGCSSSPVYPDWNRRYCSEHISDTHYCAHPLCMNPVPNAGDQKYCSQHQKLMGGDQGE